jgi:flagellar motor switch protein FliM
VRFAQTWQRARREPSTRDRSNLHQNLALVPMHVAAALDTSLQVRELLRLRPGEVLSLGRPLREAVDVRVRGATKLRGRLVTTAGRVGVRLEAAEGAAREDEAECRIS